MSATFRRSSPNSSPAGSAAPRRSRSRRACRRAGAQGCGSSARTWHTPVRTRSTTRSARRCSRSASAPGASLPRPAPDSTASPAPTGALPDALIACVGGGSNSMGAFHAFIADATVEIIGVEAGGRGAGLGDNAATLAFGRPGVLHGAYSMLLQNEDGQIRETHSVSAGLDYPGVGPEHALLSAIGRVHYQTAGDEEALAAVRALSECEGILPALESAHALAGAERWARANPGRSMLVCLSGRGDKDMSTLQQTLLGREPS